MENIFIDLKRSFIEEGSKMFKVPYSIRTIQKMLKSLNFELKKKKKKREEKEWERVYFYRYNKEYCI